jgi:hypothetical protein
MSHKLSASCELPDFPVQRRQQRAATVMPTTRTSTDDKLSLPLSPGDVLCVKGTAGGIARLGATGGFMGHVLLVIADPRCVERHSVEAVQYLNIWPGDVRMLWTVRTLESCRSVEGFHETEHLLYADRRGQLLVIGEASVHRTNQITEFETPEKVQLWRCPFELRKHFRMDMMHEVIESMRKHESSWSWSTAVRAYLFSADVSEVHDSKTDGMLQEIRRCWTSDPICTSVVIIFWQKYLCKVAEQDPEVRALDLIVQWMPVKSDRSLPGDLLSAMQNCGWSIVNSLECGKSRAESF